MRGTGRTPTPSGRHRETRADALRADSALHAGSVSNRNADRLQVRHPASLGLVIGVADVVSGPRSFATDIAFHRHEVHSLQSRGVEVKLDIISPEPEKSINFSLLSRTGQSHKTGFTLPFPETRTDGSGWKAPPISCHSHENGNPVLQGQGLHPQGPLHAIARALWTWVDTHGRSCQDSIRHHLPHLSRTSS